MSTLHRELCWIVSALQTYEHYIIGSLSLYTYIEITNRVFIYREETESYHIGS